MSQCARCETASGQQLSSGNRFLPLEPGSWPMLDKFMRARPHALAGYTLNCLAVWNHVFHYQWAFPEPETLLIGWRLAPDQPPHLLQPIGRFSSETQEALRCHAAGLSYPLQMIGVSRDFIEAHPGFVSHFNVTVDRNNHNYIYRAADLAELAGRRYSKKRNLIAQASRAYEWTVEPLTAANAEACLEVLREAGEEQAGAQGKGIENDDRAIENCVRFFSDLSLEGVLIRIQGKPAALSIFEQQTPDTVVIHFERALRKFKGLHQVTSQITAQAALSRGFAYINREEDLGDPGLRQSKESYYPAFLAEALLLTYKG
jgi:uncharacterized protein